MQATQESYLNVSKRVSHAEVALRLRESHPTPEPRIGVAARRRRRVQRDSSDYTDSVRSLGVRSGPGELDLPAVDSLALYNKWIALRPRGSEEEIEVALYLRRPRPDPKPRVEADHEDNAQGPEIGAERQGDKERKPEGLQQNNDIPSPRTALEARDSNA
ncbi:hypothetical protein NDU88_002090 [Pleurodeles waltl]|uniref:Uncharacterized protein n=1 Tax=Pleurodeles waltl TaxID=8319 RepID=A0AAV7KXX4_PLEWA|nr:hypothetical protein NDU88_002090 [Pleurodeles waltl]